MAFDANIAKVEAEFKALEDELAANEGAIVAELGLRDQFMNDLNAEIAALNALIANLTRKINDLIDERDNARLGIKTAVADADAARLALDAMRGERDAARAALAGAPDAAEFARLQAEEARLNAEVARLTAAEARLNGEIAAQNGVLNGYIARLQAITARVKTNHGELMNSHPNAGERIKIIDELRAIKAAATAADGLVGGNNLKRKKLSKSKSKTKCKLRTKRKKYHKTKRRYKSKRKHL